MSQKRFNNYFWVIFLFLCSCTNSFDKSEYQNGISKIEDRNFSEALIHFQRVMAKSPESNFAILSAKEASRISLFELKDYQKAIGFLKHTIAYAKSDRERRIAQKTLANIYFENLSDYKSAVNEINKLLILRNSVEDTVDLRFNLARAEFYLNNFEDAKSEIEQALKIVESKDKKFELQMFLGNIFLNTHKTEQAIAAYEGAIATDPERANKDNVAMNIVVCYEDAELFDKAIDKLQQMRSQYPDPEFIDLKIKRMMVRKSNLPGSKGLRK